MQRGQQLVTRHAQRFGGAVQVQAVARFILDFGQQDGLAFQGRRAGDPVPLRQLADDLRVGVLGNLAYQGLAVGVGHPVLGLDFHAGVDAGLELAFIGGHVVQRTDIFEAGLHHLCIHIVSPETCAEVRGLAVR